MKETLKEGLEYTHKYRVPENKTVPYIYPEAKVYQEMPKVFATGFMVALIEWACIEALAPHMEPGHGSVGTLINLTHSAATPPGMEVAVHVRCTKVDGQRTTWEIEARDEVDVISKGTHERFSIDFARFNARVAKKAAGAS
ncbi:MAG: thioesterase family protein [Candidatus Methylomirabilales bacterium]